jgi:hypothetical protein
MRDRPGAAAFREALPVAGESGPAAPVRRHAGGRADRAKPATSRTSIRSPDTSTLDGRDLAFSVIVNQTGGEGAVSAIDRLIVGLVEGGSVTPPTAFPLGYVRVATASSPCRRGPVVAAAPTSPLAS